jgi:hypothetical protein
MNGFKQNRSKLIERYDCFLKKSIALGEIWWDGEKMV